MKLTVKKKQNSTMKTI